MVWLLPPGKESSERERKRERERERKREWEERRGCRVFAFCLGLFGSGNNVRWQEERRREEEGRKERRKERKRRGMKE